MSEPSNRPRKSTSSTSRSSGGSSNPAVALNKLLNAPRLSATKFRTKEDVDDGLKKLRRLILLGGIPTSEVMQSVSQNSPDTDLLYRILRYAPAFGSYYFASTVLWPVIPTFNISPEGLVRTEKRLGMIPFGEHRAESCHWSSSWVKALGSMSTNSRPGVVSAPSVQESERGDIPVLTLCACTPPLAEVLRLWDFLLAFGVHLNILCVIAQLFLMRDSILSSRSPMKLLRTFPPLQAQPVIEIAVALVRDLPVELYDELVRHPFEIEL
ncbi:TBC domain-containing protein [Rhizoctonia solani AG-1 IA]|uniref:TBC domain-containing protein n=1 Tax=Thanatephorus cucumeris (strain AG1-IA) TaxID=983506 RepID=L8WWL8_THACA|nr:TBC domain-containing protein [Rhizoctonia solani AG-1 IA]